MQFVPQLFQKSWQPAGNRKPTLMLTLLSYAETSSPRGTRAAFFRFVYPPMDLSNFGIPISTWLLNEIAGVAGHKLLFTSDRSVSASDALRVKLDSYGILTRSRWLSVRENVDRIYTIL